MIDVAVSLTGLIILLPFFIIIMFLIKEASRGPAFFKQQRVGYNGGFSIALSFARWWQMPNS